MTLRKRKDILHCRRKHQIALCGEFALEQAVDLSCGINEWLNTNWIKNEKHILDSKMDVPCGKREIFAACPVNSQQVSEIHYECRLSLSGSNDI